MDFDEEDLEKDPEEGLEEDAEGDSEEEAEEFRKDNAEGGYNVDVEVEEVDRKDVISESDSDIMMWGGEPPEQGDLMSESGSEIIMWEERPPEPEIVELSDSEEQLDMSNSLSVETSTDSESTSRDEYGDADFDPDLYKEYWDRMDASPFAK